MNSIDYFLKVKASDIYLYAPFFEAFEGMLAFRTPAPPEGEHGILHILVSPHFKTEFEALISRLGLEQA